MQLKEHLVEGSTERIVEILDVNGSALQDSSDLSVRLFLRTCAGELTIYEEPQVGFVSPGVAADDSDESQAEVFFDPEEGDLLESEAPYTASWVVTLQDGKIAFFPTREPILWKVRKP